MINMSTKKSYFKYLKSFLGKLENYYALDECKRSFLSVQDCSNSSALAMELPQSFTKPSIWCKADKRRAAVHLLEYWKKTDKKGQKWNQ